MRIIFYGESIWTENFGQWFTKETSFPDPDVRQLDFVDNQVKELAFEELRNGSNFDLMTLHLIGLDHSGHTYGPRHPELQRKLLETEDIIAKIIELMDDKTTLVVFGDHGMTEGGSHGSSSMLEMSTVLFSYQKTPFPMAKKYRAMQNHFSKIDMAAKQADLAPIGATLLNVPIPFANLGFAHPAFSQTNDFSKVVKNLRANIEQIYTYLKTYCK